MHEITAVACGVQGIVGTMPWNAIAFLTLWLQLLGFSDWQASVLSAAFYGASSAGAFLGGYVGDRAARCAPNSGRITTAQFSVRPPCPPPRARIVYGWRERKPRLYIS